MSYGYYGNSDYSNYIFISSPEDLKKEISYDDIGKEIFCLTKHAFCETCNKTLKAYGSEAKAQAMVDKHLGYKKYAGHKAFVKTVEFPDLKKCTTADIIGTKANMERNASLRRNFTSQIAEQLVEIEKELMPTIKAIEKIFGVEYIGNNFNRDDEEGFGVTSVKRGIFKFYIRTEDKYIHFEPDLEALLRAEDLIFNKKQIYNDGDQKTIHGIEVGGKSFEDKDLLEKAQHIHFLVKPAGFGDNVRYSWMFDYNLEAFVGFDSPVPDCDFCKKPIKSWSDAGISQRHYGIKVPEHKDCIKHSVEAENLERYAKDLEEKKIAQEVTAS